MKVHSLLCYSKAESTESSSSAESLQSVTSSNLGLSTLAIAAALAESAGPTPTGVQANKQTMVKPKRKRASPVQVSILKQYYKKNPFPDTECRHFLACKLNMTPRSVQIWFQNQRQHDKAMANLAQDPTLADKITEKITGTKPPS